MGYHHIPTAVLAQAFEDLMDDADPVRQTSTLGWVLNNPMFGWWVERTEGLENMEVAQVRAAFLRAAGWGRKVSRATDPE